MKKDFDKFFKRKIKENILVKKKLYNLIIKKKILQSINIIYNSLSSGGKVLLCGNGGSAADAQHLAAEFLVRLRSNVNRKPLPAIALTMDVSTITACANDYSFKKIFSRNLDAIANKNDILIALSTSGNSKNILEVLKMANKKKIFSVAFLGNSGGEAKKLANLSLIVPSRSTARIQEAHIFLGHVIFERVEDLLLKR
jgi:D-sedoheptulose 7-phosphate isomerase